MEGSGAGESATGASGAGASGAGGSGAGGSGAGAGGAAPTPLTAPRVLFTDLESGPAGAYVTLYGVRLVEDGEEPEVTLDGVPVAPMHARDGASNDDVARALDVIVVRVGPDVPLGSADIVVHRGGVASEPVPFTVRAGTIRYVDADGGDDLSPDCAEAAPCASLDRLERVIAPGDVAYVRKGDYRGTFACDVNWDDQTITCALPLTDLASPGTATRPIAVVGYPGERPRVGLLGAPAGAEELHTAFRVAGAGHVVLSNLVFTDAGVAGSVSDTDGLRVVGCRFESYALDGVYMGASVDAVTILGSTFAAGALPSERGVGACNATKVALDVGFCEFDRVPEPLTVDPTDAIDVRLHHSRFYKPRAGLNLEMCPVSNGQPAGRTTFFGNVVEDADQALILPKASTAGAEVLVFNNTFYGLANCGFRREDPTVAPIPGGEAIHVRNNVVVPLRTPYFCFHDAGVITPAEDVGLLGSHNLFWNGTGTVPAALGDDADPLLVQPPGDVSLGADSPGIDAGTEVLGGDASALPPFVRTDYGGLPRVLGDGIDIGAHERAPE
ncbi:choice-of-anchor Q domain-containing protein [Sorangium sp. So ce216]